MAIYETFSVAKIDDHAPFIIPAAKQIGQQKEQNVTKKA